MFDQQGKEYLTSEVHLHQEALEPAELVSLEGLGFRV